MTDSTPQATRPRNPFVRLARAMALWFVLWIPAGVASRAITAQAERLFPGDHLVSDSVSLLPYLVPFTALAFLLRLVAYRRRDILIALIPFWGIGFTSVVCWRLAGLPHVDWSTGAHREPRS
ncbi:hypothetical protein [Actinocorallia aurantiaca]|uniref:Uncharacterized protein n=1 Tax=Actinocorallia aurantiaca TaxID=46204 RepID=A0ABN3UL08_9ACTN